ncbi:MAG: PIN domain-containing protein [Chitinophagaceae bacterium]|nr:PIN domain-containing protein [Chitinophagaceae bacterium]
MMFTTNNLFIDTSVLIENVKGNKKGFLLSLLQGKTLSCFINETVVSEFMFHFLKLNGNASPQSSQSSGKIPLIIKLSDDYHLIRLFHFLPSDGSLTTLVPSLMATYNLLPNDAIILATCKIHGITKLASHDGDFTIPCQKEGIELLTQN